MKMEDFEAYKAAVAEGNPKKITYWENKILKDNVLLGYKLMHRYAKGLFTDIQEDDAKQAAAIGMLKSLRRWDPSRAKFSTLAGWWVRSELQKTAQKEDPLYSYINGQKRRPCAYLIDKFYTKNGYYGTCEEMGVTPKEYEMYFVDKHYAKASIHYIGEDPAPTPEELREIADDCQELVDQYPKDELIPLWALAKRKAFQIYVNKLPPKKRQAIMDLATDKFEAFHKIAKRYGISVEDLRELWAEVDEYVRDYWHVED
jgi:RNA polymerase sigma factor (sigma-70 family)